tara:strand:+ start:4211 stop:4396 length:186 start_codon:yes stop_codon:yes gene_type:complete
MKLLRNFWFWFGMALLNLFLFSFSMALEMKEMALLNFLTAVCCCLNAYIYNKIGDDNAKSK